MAAAIQSLQELMTRQALGSPVALYLTGSYCDGGLRPESDLDVLLVTRLPLQIAERRLLVEHLLAYSGRRATKQTGRPVELTSLVLDDVRPWRYPAVRDFLYGEWLRSDHEAGLLPGRETDPNLPVILTSARQHSRVLMGPPLTDIIDPVPREHLTQSMFDALPGLLDDLGDERNVLLTLARILYTLRTGSITTKDRAAADVCCTLPPADAHVLDLAARADRGEVRDEWTPLGSAASATARALPDRIYSLRS